MLKLSGVSKRFGGRMVLDRVSFVLNSDATAGLVGPSGCGKTTLLRIIAGLEPADAGSVEATPGLVAGYLRQGHHRAGHLTVGEAFPAVFAAGAGEAELEAIGRRMAEERDPARAEALSAAYARALARVESAPTTADIGALWRDLGLRLVSPHERVGALSGGEQTKLGLLDLAAARPGMLLLDEPTNNLDIAGLEWLGDYLERFQGPVLLVSHDRAFLDDHVVTILELDLTTGRLEAFPGAYSDYREEKARRHAELWERYVRQQAHERRIQQAITGLKSRAQRTENRTIHFYFRKRALKVARRAVTLQRRLQRELESEQHVEKPVRLPHRVRAEIEAGQRAGSRMVLAEGLALEIGGRPLLRDIDLELGWGERAVLLGPNGAGKTTLLRAILGEHPVAGGVLRLGPSVRIGYLPQATGAEDRGPGAEGRVSRAECEHPAPSTQHSALSTRHPAPGTPLSVIRATVPLSESEARRFLHRFLFAGDQALTPVARLSYGERRRLDLARLVVAGANLLVLDEPTNHLDIQSREALEAALEEFEGAMLVVTHDRYFIDRFADRVLAVENGRLWEM
jgi:ATP-binding cassette subfamily F protein 3